MKLVFAAAFALLVASSLVAWAIAPPATVDGRIVLTLVSDPNPARYEQIALFNRLHPEYELRLDPDNGGTQKVIVQAMAGVGPDLFHCYTPFDLSAYVRAGIAWDVGDELARRGIDVGRCWRAGDATAVVDGRRYGHPDNVAVDALWFDRSVFDAEGLPYPRGPWTWDGFLPLARRLVRRDATGRTTRFGVLVDRWKWPEFVLQHGGAVYSADGTRCVIDSPAAVAGIRRLRDLMYVERVMPTPYDEQAMVSEGGWGGGGCLKLFAARRAALAIGGRWWLCQPGFRGNPDLPLGVTEAPTGPRRVFLGYGKSTLVNRSSPRRDAALAYLAFQHGREFNELINRQADGLAPVAAYCDGDAFLHDPDHPEERDNAVWRDVMALGVTAEVSPFVNGGTAMRLIGEQLELVWDDRKDAADAMRAAARAVNAEIDRAVAEDPALARRYAAAVAAAGAAP